MSVENSANNHHLEMHWRKFFCNYFIAIVAKVKPENYPITLIATMGMQKFRVLTALHKVLRVSR